MLILVDSNCTLLVQQCTLLTLDYVAKLKCVSMIIYKNKPY